MTKLKTQTLDQFVADELERLARFRRDWINNNKKAPDQWPMRNIPGDWDDQYLMFSDPSPDAVARLVEAAQRVLDRIHSDVTMAGCIVTGRFHRGSIAGTTAQEDVDAFRAALAAFPEAQNDP